MIKNKLGLSLLATIGFFLIVSSCNSGDNSNKRVTHHDNTSTISQDNSNAISKAICVLTPTVGNNVKGTVTFTQTDAGILIEANVEGLSEGKYGFHIHEFGDISKSDGTSAGGHFNPEDKEHAGPEHAIRHAGEFGNIIADENGNAHYERVDSLISFKGVNNIVGRSIIIHEDSDDLVSQPTGDAGGRVAHGVIGVAK